MESKESRAEGILEAARRMQSQDGFVFMDSSRVAYGMGRFSLLAARPLAEARYREGIGEILKDGETVRFKEDPFVFLSRVLERFGSESSGSLTDGGLMGYLSYDLGRYIERIPHRLEDEGAYDLRFFVYDRFYVWDALEKTWVDGAPDGCDSSELTSDFEIGGLKSNFEKSEYLEAVERIRGLIKTGDVYQVNLSQQFSAGFEGDEWTLYERLRELSPSQYGAYLDFGDEVILSSSPERFLTKDVRSLETRPIKGTRPRGATEEADAIQRKDLEQSEKDRSELLMIVDLERNDLGRVCEAGSIEVSELFQLESYANVIHQTATVKGRAREDVEGVHCVKALFPGGSITGAPKIRAMEVIEELERARRGVYTGAIGYFAFNGDLDFNIAIRTMKVSEGLVRFNVGGGIVWDSDPNSEYSETLDKARSMMKALGKAIDE